MEGALLLLSRNPVCDAQDRIRVEADRFGQLYLEGHGRDTSTHKLSKCNRLINGACWRGAGIAGGRKQKILVGHHRLLSWPKLSSWAAARVDLHQRVTR